MPAKLPLLLLVGEAAALTISPGAHAARGVRGARALAPIMAISVDFSSEALPFVTMENAAGDSAKVYPFGACVTSYVKDGTDVLMVRPDAKMDGSKPISGGIPFCFPQFGPGDLQQHGFARNVNWNIAEQTDGDAPAIVFKLTDNEYTRGMWDFPFEATYTVTLGADALDTEFKVSNTGPDAFKFTGALHSYWSVSGISNLKIAGGFEGASFLDKTAETPAKSTCDTGVIEISKETDSVYEQVAGEVKLQDSGRGSELTIKSEGWADTVVWNPYGDENMGYDSFVCVECAKALEPITVEPNAEWIGKMTVTPGSL